MIAIERLNVPAHDALGAGKAPTVPDYSASSALTSMGERPFSKARTHHLERQAVVYVRQSTPHQVVEHTESLARQYALRERAMALGWPSPSVLVIDQDLGLSGSGCENRLGFQRLLADVAQDRVGLVLALEISRLARNSRDWHNLFDLCAVRDVLLADEDGVYDPSDINDRLILGMKGIMSELELHIMK
jgi:DNA invertase Pin-like site-specific DNA recombinase